MDKNHFNFYKATQEDEDLDFSEMVPCPLCKKPIPRNATMCLYCGGSVGYLKKPGWFVFAAILLIIIFIFFAVLF